MAELVFISENCGYTWVNCDRDELISEWFSCNHFLFFFVMIAGMEINNQFERLKQRHALQMFMGISKPQILSGLLSFVC